MYSRSFKNSREIIWGKAIFGLKSEVRNSYLNYLWWLIEPVLYLLVYYLVFEVMLLRGGENYFIFLLSGLIPWMWFMKSVSASSNSIIHAKNLILHIRVNPVLFPIISALQVTIKQIPIFVLLLIATLLYGNSYNNHWLMLFPVIFLQVIIVFSISCLVASIVPFLRDLSYIIPSGLTFLMFLSGIFYSYKSISIEWQAYFLMNPIAYLLKCYREIFIDGISPDLSLLGFWLSGFVLFLIIIIFVISYNQCKFSRVLMK